jgi:hypothetical protein
MKARGFTIGVLWTAPARNAGDHGWAVGQSLGMVRAITEKGRSMIV